MLAVAILVAVVRPELPDADSVVHVQADKTRFNSYVQHHYDVGLTSLDAYDADGRKRVSWQAGWGPLLWAVNPERALLRTRKGDEVVYALADPRTRALYPVSRDVGWDHRREKLLANDTLLQSCGYDNVTYERTECIYIRFDDPVHSFHTASHNNPWAEGRFGKFGSGYEGVTYDGRVLISGDCSQGHILPSPSGEWIVAWLTSIGQHGLCRYLYIARPFRGKEDPVNVLLSVEQAAAVLAVWLQTPSPISPDGQWCAMPSDSEGSGKRVRRSGEACVDGENATEEDAEVWWHADGGSYLFRIGDTIGVVEVDGRGRRRTLVDRCCLELVGWLGDYVVYLTPLIGDEVPQAYASREEYETAMAAQEEDDGTD